MLATLQVRNFGLIERLELTFGPGLNIITGETGAGKSMLIDAMVLVCGGRASTEAIRTGCDRATIDAVFDLTELPELREHLSAAGIGVDSSQVVLSRELNTSGRHISRIGGRPVTTALAREAASCLVDIHGQHEHQSLMQPHWHREVLDAYGGPDHAAIVSEVQALSSHARELEARLARVAGNSRDRAQREDLLRFQLSEIESAALRPGEERELREERHLLINSERLSAAAEAAYRALFEASGAAGPRRGAGGPGAGSPARDALAWALAELEPAANLDERLAETVETLRTMVYTLDDMSREMRSYRDALEYDPGRIEAVQTRLEQLGNLRRKYADTIEGVIAHAAAVRVQLDELASSEALAAQLESELSAAKEAYLEAATRLSAAREAVARRLAKAVGGELGDLGMPAAVFEVAVTRHEAPLSDDQPNPTLAAHGLDDVEFMLSTNPGEPPRRVIRAASGGELSRVMLALKTVLAQAEDIPSMIFDEVDAGIGGRTANAVGLRLARLGRTHQVLCVTHLPQIAAYADHHFVVAKESQPDQTRTGIVEVIGDDRLHELARMLGGEAGARSAVDHARQMIDQSSRNLRTAG